VNTIHLFDECLTHSSTLELETNSISNTLRLFHIGLVLQMMGRKEKGQNSKGYKVLEVEALKI
jgi:hypothetical protein